MQSTHYRLLSYRNSRNAGLVTMFGQRPDVAILLRPIIVLLTGVLAIDILLTAKLTAKQRAAAPEPRQLCPYPRYSAGTAHSDS